MADITAKEVEALPQKKKKKKKPSKAGRKETASPDTETQRQLNVLQGALSALKNVLASQGVDVSQILTANADKSSIPALEAKPNPKSKSKAKAEKGDKIPKAATTPNASGQKAKNTTPESQSSISVTGTETAQPDGVVEPPAPASDVAPPNPPYRKVRSVSKVQARRKPLTELSPTKKSTTRSLRRTMSKQMEQSEPPEGHSWALLKPEALKPLPRKSRPIKSAPTSNKLPDKVRPDELSLVPIETSPLAVPGLSYGLERVIFNPGVYQLQDPRSRVYNFDPYLSEIMPVDEFDFNALKEYVTSSKDTTLISIAKQNQKKYAGSTSSMTSMLGQFHYLLSAWRDVNVSMLSRSIQPESVQYTRIMRAPAATFLHWKDGTYAIDADKEFDTANILSMLGKSMEKLLTLPKDEYERYRRGNSDQITEEERNAEEAYHYTGFQDFMMRSQLDAYDPRVPGTGMFDLKTRAVISIRMDAKGYEKGLGYEIRQRFGQWASFEREYFDMIRSAFLKYSLQVRMGRMDGIFVAFHNTQRIFGFQYIPLTEMDLALHGTDNRQLGDHEFKVSLKLLNELLDRATQKWPEKSLRLHFETRQSKGAPFMYFFAKPTTPEEIAAVQNAGRASVEAFEKNILGLAERAAEEVEHQTEVDDGKEDDLVQVAPSPAQEIDSFAAWQEARQMVEEAMGDDEDGVGLVREAIGDALEQSGILHARSLAESREYVDALLEALIGRTPFTQGDVVTTRPNEEEAIDEDELEEQAAEQTQEESAKSCPPTLLHSEIESATFNSALGQGVDLEESAEGLYPSHTSTKDSSPTRDDRDIHTDSPELEVSSSLGGSPHLSQPGGNTHEMQPHDSQTNSTEDTTKKTGPLASNPRDLQEEFEEEDDYEETGEAELESDIGAKEFKEDVGSSTLEPLKSLIMRMARRIDEQPVSDTIATSPQDDASKLREFERILGQLISQARTDQFESDGGDDLLGQNPSSELTTPNGSFADVSSSNQVAVTPDAQQEGTPQPAVAEQTQPKTPESELLALTLTIKNKVNGAYVDRPTELGKDDDWTVEYEIEEVKQPRANTIYESLKERRRKVFQDAGDKETQWHFMFSGNLPKYTQEGREFRKQETERAEGQPVYTVDARGPLEWRDVFRRQPKNLQTSDEASTLDVPEPEVGGDEEGAPRQTKDE